MGVQKIKSAITLWVLVVLMGCAPAVEEDGVFSVDCDIPADQFGTLLGRWDGTPVPMALHEGAFTDAEKEDLLEAAQKWNQFFEQGKSLKVFELGDGSSPYLTFDQYDPNLCGLDSIYESDSNQFSSTVNIYKVTSGWPASLKHVLAVAGNCIESQSEMIYNSVLRVNYEYFGAEDQRRPDLISLALHEFGHILGLNHSCDFSPIHAGIPQCSFDMDMGYLEAVMYPALSFDYTTRMGELKRSLRQNDQDRANCLYGI